MTLEEALVIFLSLAFVISFVSNLLLALAIIRLKLREEKIFKDRKRHFDVLYIALALGNSLGALLIFPPLLHMYSRGSEQKIDYGKLCHIYGSLVSFHFTYGAVLTLEMHVHHLCSVVWPFHYFIFTRTKNSKVPYICILLSLVAAILAGVLPAVGLGSFINTTKASTLTVHCLPDFQPALSRHRVALYFNMAVGFCCLLTTLCLFVRVIYEYVKMKRVNIRTHQGCCGLPEGAVFVIAKGLLYITTWSPCLILMTIITCSSTIHVPPDVVVITYALLFVPGLLGPCVYYFTHEDLRDICNESARRMCLTEVRQTAPGNREGNIRHAPGGAVEMNNVQSV